MPRLIPHDHRWARAYDEVAAVVGAVLLVVGLVLAVTNRGGSRL